MKKFLKGAAMLLCGAALGLFYGTNKEKVDNTVKDGFDKVKGMCSRKPSCCAEEVKETIEETLD